MRLTTIPPSYFGGVKPTGPESKKPVEQKKETLTEKTLDDSLKNLMEETQQLEPMDLEIDTDELPTDAVIQANSKEYVPDENIETQATTLSLENTDLDENDKKSQDTLKTNPRS